MAITIGLTYDLRSEYLTRGFTELEVAEFDRDDTVEALEKALQALGYRTERIGNARQLATALVQGRRWDVVFNIAEGLHGVSREAQVPALLDLYEIPYTFSDALTMSLTLHKGMTKHVIRDAGVPTSDFFVAESGRDAEKVGFAPPYFIKPVAEGTGKGVSPASIIRDLQGLRLACEQLTHIFNQAAIIEPYLPGREFTVGILGTGSKSRALGSVEVHLRDTAEPGAYSYVNKERCEELVIYRLVRATEDPVVARAEAISLSAWKVLGCRDAGRIDIRCNVDGDPLFMEVNPLAGIHPEHSDLPIICNRLGIPYLSLIKEIVDSAAARIGKKC
jgi:D-alanine-D-alanine ligase